MHCPACQHENKPVARFCEACGARLARTCPSCGEEAGAQARFCPACGATIDEPVSPAERRQVAGEATSVPAGERRQLTVLFCDLVGSTPLSQQVDAEEWRDVIAQYQKAARTAVERWGGHVAKTLGDGLLIYFGWPDAREDDPERAIRAGLEAVEAVRRLAVTRFGEEGSSPDTLTANRLTGNRLSVRVGMHTGPVVIADGGEVFGETPNIAARVQGAAEPDTVVVTAATQRLAAGIFVLEDRGPQALKGVREPMVLYRVLQPSGVRSRLDVAAGRLTRFIGRDVELATLVDRWDRAADGEGQNVLIVGEAGVGKSRLAYQLRERLATTPHTWLECGTSPYTEGTPFHPVIALVAQGLAFSGTDTTAEKIAKIERGLRDLASPENVALLADFLGLPPPTSFTMKPDVRRRKTMELLAQWNLALSTIQPLVLLVEDLHWSDDSSLELLGRIIAQSATARVLVVATARPEFTAPWPARSNSTTVQLARLTKRQAREMVTRVLSLDTRPEKMAATRDDRFGSAGPETTPFTPISDPSVGSRIEGLSDAVIDALVARADGVPLYVEELTKAVAEPGTAPGADAIPPTLAGSLMARLDRLSAAKEVAQRAAVLGREFDYRLLAAVAGMQEAGLRQGLARLVGAEIVFQRGEPPEATYTFKHALVQEAAYESLLKRTRQQLHGRVVDALVDRFPERVTREPEVVARHAAAAGRIDEGVKYLRDAGEQAQARSAHGEAIIQFRRAIAQIASQPEGTERERREVALQLALGASLVAVRGFAHRETETAYARSWELAERVDDASHRAVARIGLSVLSISRGDPGRGRTHAVEVLAQAERQHDVEEALSAYTQIAAADLYQGQFVSSLAHAERALALYDPERHHTLVSVLGTDQAVASLSYVACNLWMLGLPDTALSRAEQAVGLARQRDHPFGSGFALSFAATVNWLRGNRLGQHALGAELISLSQVQGFPLWLGIGHVWQGAARVAAGDAAALAELLEGLALAGETGNQAGAPMLLGLFAEAQQAVGLLADAQQTVASGLALADHTGQHSNDAELHRLDGDLLLATGGADDEAAARYQRALAIAREQGAHSFELRAATSLARLWRDQGKRAEARDLLAPVYGWFTEGFETQDPIDAKALLDELGRS